MSDMSLPEGKTCVDCYAYQFCKGLFSCKPGSTECDYFPVRFRAKETPTSRVAGLKPYFVAFFQWWWNQPGSNTEQGFDQWVREGHAAELEAALAQGRDQLSQHKPASGAVVSKD